MSAESKQPIVRDTLGRPLKSLRLSVTDRCNLRCLYCMPEEEYVWLPREELLTFEELQQLVDIFTGLGVTDIRLTGGEPLLRHQLDRLIAMLAASPNVHDLLSRQWGASRRPGGSLEARRTASAYRQPRYAEARALPRYDAP